jgi:hypothetical protein
MPRAPHTSPPFLLIRNQTGLLRVQARRKILSAFFERSRIRGNLNGGGLLLEITTGDGSIRFGKF